MSVAVARPAVNRVVATVMRIDQEVAVALLTVLKSHPLPDLLVVVASVTFELRGNHDVLLVLHALHNDFAVVDREDDPGGCEVRLVRVENHIFVVVLHLEKLADVALDGHRSAED